MPNPCEMTGLPLSPEEEGVAFLAFLETAEAEHALYDECPECEVGDFHWEDIES